MTLQRAGDLRHRVTILRLAAPSTGTRGQREAAYKEFDRRYAHFEYLSGNELEQARKVYSQTVARVTIRKPNNYQLTTKDRITFGGMVYGVGSIVASGDSFQDFQILLSEVT